MSGAAARTGILNKKEGRERYKNRGNGVAHKNQQKKAESHKIYYNKTSEEYR